MTGVTVDWDGRAYDRVAAPMTARGTELVDRLRLRGDEAALDLGCGSGRVTARLLARLPRGRVTALDASPGMLAAARRVLGDDPRLTLVEADLRGSLPVPPAQDVVVSTSTLHWVPGHPALFHRIAAVMRPGAVLAADFGGDGNIAAVLAALDDAGEPFRPWTFPTLPQTAAALAGAGLAVEEIGRTERPHVLGSRGELVEYLRTVVLPAHVARMAPPEATALVEAVADRLPDRRVDYVRTEVIARRPG